MSVTADLAEFVASTEEIPEDVRARSKQAIRDYFGVGAYGAQSDVGDTLRAYAESSPADGECATLDGARAGVERAAMLNGAFGHAVDFDDTFSSFPMHPTVVATAAALAAGQHADSSGDDFVRAYAVGVETMYQVGHSVFPEQYSRGFHSTAAVGPLGAVATAGTLLELGTRKLRHAFGIAASSAGGLRKNFGTTTKPLHAGFAASAGVRAALLADAGATADRDIFDGETGYGAVMAGDEYDPSWFDAEFGEGVRDVALKLYPSAHITHGSMEALRRLREREGLTQENVSSISAAMHPGGADVLIHSDPSTGLEAKFSIEFCLAAVLREGMPTLAEFEESYVTAPETRAAMALVEPDYDANAVAEMGRYAGVVTVETTDGETYVEAADAPGSPENPASEERLRAKFDDCVAETAVDGDALADVIENLEEETVADLVSAL
jgi:2-methylcitrate dehydratase PrpD